MAERGVESLLALAQEAAKDRQRRHNDLSDQINHLKDATTRVEQQCAEAKLRLQHQRTSLYELSQAVATARSSAADLRGGLKVQTPTPRTTSTAEVHHCHAGGAHHAASGLNGDADEALLARLHRSCNTARELLLEAVGCSTARSSRAAAMLVDVRSTKASLLRERQAIYAQLEKVRQQRVALRQTADAPPPSA